MSQTDTEKERQKEAMKRLRQQRQKTVDASKEKVKLQTATIRNIKGLLKEGPKTVPEISAAVSIPTSEALWCVMSLKKYGELVEAEQDGSYFRYGLAAGEAKGGEV